MTKYMDPFPGKAELIHDLPGPSQGEVAMMPLTKSLGSSRKFVLKRIAWAGMLEIFVHR